MAANQDVHITLQFPLAGLDKSGSYRSSPPHGTVSCMNVRPPDVYEARRRGGSRPGLSKVTPDATISTGTGSAVLDVNSVTYLDTDDAPVTKLVRVTGGTAPALRYVTSAEWAQKLFVAIPDNMTVFDPEDESTETWEAEDDPDVSPADTKGEVPTGCPLIARYRDRLFLAGEPSHMWYCSRTGNPYDWDYGQADPGRAVSGMNSEAGTVGEPITAMFSHGDSYLVFGCANAIWMMRGDPAFGGRIDNVSRTVGIVGPHAWTHGPGGILYFLGSNGLMMLPPGLGGVPQPVSQYRLPKELKGLDPAMYRFALAYDALANGLHIYVTHNTQSANDKMFWYDIGNESFWPFTVRASERAISRGYLNTAAEGLKAIMGGTTGNLTSFDSGVEEDVEEDAVASHVVYGPVLLGGSEYLDGMVVELIATLAVDSHSVRWKLYVGESPEHAATLAANDSNVFATGIWASGDKGLNFTERPRGRGGAFALRIQSISNRSWATESIHAKCRNLGVKRKLG